MARPWASLTCGVRGLPATACPPCMQAHKLGHAETTCARADIRLENLDAGALRGVFAVLQVRTSH